LDGIMDIRMVKELIPTWVEVYMWVNLKMV
jgi:hypothetical protein